MMTMRGEMRRRMRRRRMSLSVMIRIGRRMSSEGERVAVTVL
jgi:hypothetical protein